MWWRADTRAAKCGIGAILMATDRLTSEYAQQARFGPFTGAFNRHALFDCCTDELAHSQRASRGLGCADHALYEAKGQGRETQP